MMRGSRRLVIYAALTGLLALGATGTGMMRASANTLGTACAAIGNKASCTARETIDDPAEIQAGISDLVNQNLVNGGVAVSWSESCSVNGSLTPTSGGAAGTTPLNTSLPLPSTTPDYCSVALTATLTGSGEVLVQLSYVTAPLPPPTPIPVGIHLVRGYAGKCVDDNRNSSANGSKIQIWGCNSSDQAQSWAFANGELVHNGKCANDEAWGGSGSHVILWTCDHAQNELWTHNSDGAYVLSAKGGTLCLDDTAYSTRNGTQLIVYACKGSSSNSNQRWSLP